MLVLAHIIECWLGCQELKLNDAIMIDSRLRFLVWLIILVWEGYLVFLGSRFF